MPDARLQRTRDAYPGGTFVPEKKARLPAMWTDQEDASPRLTLAADREPPVAWRVRWFTIQARPRQSWRHWWLDLRYLLCG